MKIIPRSTHQQCYSHFCKQAGLGPVFEGGTFQRGSGLFSNFRSVAAPILSPLFSKAKTYLLRKGADFLSDISSGTSFKDAAKNRLGEVKSDLINTIVGKQEGSGRRRKRRRVNLSAPFPYVRRQKGRGRKRKQIKRCGRKKPKKRKKTDIFD